MFCINIHSLFVLEHEIYRKFSRKLIISFNCINDVIYPTQSTRGSGGSRLAVGYLVRVWRIIHSHIVYVSRKRISLSLSFERGRLAPKLNGATSPINLSWDDPVSKIRVPRVSVTCFWKRWHMYADTHRTRRDVVTHMQTRGYDMRVRVCIFIFIHTYTHIYAHAHSVARLPKYSSTVCIDKYEMHSMVITIFGIPSDTKSENISLHHWHRIRVRRMPRNQECRNQFSTSVSFIPTIDSETSFSLFRKVWFTAGKLLSRVPYILMTIFHFIFRVLVKSYNFSKYMRRVQFKPGFSLLNINEKSPGFTWTPLVHHVSV